MNIYRSENQIRLVWYKNIRRENEGIHLSRWIMPRWKTGKVTPYVKFWSKR